MRPRWTIGCWILAGCVAGSGVARLATPAAPPAPPTSAVSPVDQFRRMLALSPADLERELSARPDAQRRALSAKLQEYRELPPEARELRLQATELRWYLRPLMSLEAPNRVERLRAVPPAFVDLVTERLAAWDALPEEMRRALLQNERFIGPYLRAQAARPHPWAAEPGAMSAGASTNTEPEWLRWNALPEERRQKIADAFQRFFELSPGEQDRTLRVLSPEERRQMESTLAAFAGLPPAQRALCLKSFRQFARLSPSERAEFLRNADRWQAMSPEERKLWRRLVEHLPPMPPGFGAPPMPGPIKPGRTNSGEALSVSAAP